MDKFQQLASQADFAVCVFGNAESSTFELIDLDSELTDERSREFSERHMRFIGVMGLVQGRPRVAYAEPLDEMDTSALCKAFIQRLEAAINASMPPKYRLPDARPN